MDNARHLEILERLATGDRVGQPSAARLCEVCAELTDVSGAGIMLMADGLTQGTICATDTVGVQIAELQYTLGEGPSCDAYRDGEVVSEPDLAGGGASRWPVFAPSALEAGARAVFGVPVTVGSVRLGAVDLYRRRPGPLTAAQYEYAIAVSDVVGKSILLMQASAPAGGVGPALAAGADLRRVVHQASGMVSVQLDIGVEAALVCLRASAFSHSRSVVAVAEDVVARRIRLD